MSVTNESRTDDTAPEKTYVIVGAGLVGAAAAYHLSEQLKGQAGINIVVMETSPEGVQRGGSKGGGRITRCNTHEKPFFKKMAEESNKLLLQLGTVTPAPAIIVGNYRKPLAAAVECAKQNLDPKNYDVLRGPQIEEQYSFMASNGFKCVSEHAMDDSGIGGGVINPNLTIKTLIDLAKKNGATVSFNTNMVDYREQGGKVEVTYQKSNAETAGKEAATQTVSADKLILATGPWIGQHPGESSPLADAIKPKVAPVYMFEIPDEHLNHPLLSGFPAVMLKIEGGREFAENYPGFVEKYPQFGNPNANRQIYLMREPTSDGKMVIKVGVFVPSEQQPKNVDDLLKKQATEKEKQVAGDMLKHFLPGLAEIIPAVAKAMPDRVDYAPIDETPDDMMVLDKLKPDSNVVVVTGLSGIGAKIAMELGRYVTLMALDREREIPQEAREAMSLHRDVIAHAKENNAKKAAGQLEVGKKSSSALEQKDGASKRKSEDQMGRKSGDEAGKPSTNKRLRR